MNPCRVFAAGYSIDITLPQLRIAIEADGPSHTSRTPGGAMLGATAMKRRHLQRLGWQVINVPYKVRPPYDRPAWHAVHVVQAGPGTRVGAEKARRVQWQGGVQCFT